MYEWYEERKIIVACFGGPEVNFGDEAVCVLFSGHSPTALSFRFEPTAKKCLFQTPATVLQQTIRERCSSITSQVHVSIQLMDFRGRSVV